MHVINVGTGLKEAKDHSITNTVFIANETMLDADLVIWNPNQTVNEFKAYFDPNDSNGVEILLEHIDRRRKEFNEFFRLGRILILISPSFNTDSLLLENKISPYNCLPIEKQTTTVKVGRNVSCAELDESKEFLRIFGSIFTYRYKYDEFSGNPLFYINGTSHLVAQYFFVENGVILCLPDFSRLNGDRQNSGLFISSIFELSSKLKEKNKNDGFEIPEWSNQYYLSNEELEINKLNNLNYQLEQINKEIKEQKEKLEKIQQLKLLFCSDGSQLEKIVGFIFEKFGFEVDIQNSNRDDIILKIDNKVAVVEVKGLTKSAGEKNAAQLEKWVSSYLADNNINPKGILIVNTYKKQLIEERKSEDFPNQMLSYCKNREHCLISGIQLLCLYLDFIEDKISQEEVVNKIFNTVGILTYTNQPQNYIRKIEANKES